MPGRTTALSFNSVKLNAQHSFWHLPDDGLGGLVPAHIPGTMTGFMWSSGFVWTLGLIRLLPGLGLGEENDGIRTQAIDAVLQGMEMKGQTLGRRRGDTSLKPEKKQGIEP